MAQDQEERPPSGGTSPSPATPLVGAGARAPRTGAGPRAGRSPARPPPASRAGPPGPTRPAVAELVAEGATSPAPGGRPRRRPPKRTVSGAMMGLGGGGPGRGHHRGPGHRQGRRNNTNNSYTPVTLAPASVVHDVTNIPAVGVQHHRGHVTHLPVNPPTVTKNQPPLTLNGKTPSCCTSGPSTARTPRPSDGPSPRRCPGSGPGRDSRSPPPPTPTCARPPTPSATTGPASRALHPVVTREIDSNVPIRPTARATRRCSPSPPRRRSWPPSTAVASSSRLQGGISFPFVSSTTRSGLGGQLRPGDPGRPGWQQIASGLSDPNNATTQAIVATANYLTAWVCASTKNAPAAVCTSPGVQAAAKALKLG